MNTDERVFKAMKKALQTFEEQIEKHCLDPTFFQPILKVDIVGVDYVVIKSITIDEREGKNHNRED